MAKGLKVIYCVGEKLEEREAGTTEAVVAEQMEALLKAEITGFGESLVVIPAPAVASRQHTRPARSSSVLVPRALTAADRARCCADRVRARVGHRHRQGGHAGAGAGGVRLHPQVGRGEGVGRGRGRHAHPVRR